MALRQVRPRELAGLRSTLAALPAERNQAPGGTLLQDTLQLALAPDAQLGQLLQAIAEESAVLLRGVA